MSKKVGGIHAKNIMFFRVHVGEADGGTDAKYEMATQVNDSSPIIESKQTGKWFTLPWADIVKLAVDRGIDK